MNETPFRVVRVDIHGQQYAIRSRLEPEYVAELASYLNRRMQAAAEATHTADSLRLAVLAALNITDEVFRCRQAQVVSQGEFAERAQQLERLVDEVLALTAEHDLVDATDSPVGMDRAG